MSFISLKNLDNSVELANVMDITKNSNLFDKKLNMLITITI